MYNRYIPAEDGTYRRQVVCEHREACCPPKECTPEPPKASVCCPPPEPSPCGGPKQKSCPRPESPPPGFFPGISLPGISDRSDLLILLILLLLSDSGEDSTSLLLTAALYFLIR